ncbi:MAG: M48 family metalloprotease [Planctomycetes bacterium]|nr:M48 family metalloprotease [Planctomycetota bacterium]
MLIFFYLIASYILYTLVDSSAIGDGGYLSPLNSLAGFLLVSALVWCVGRIAGYFAIKNIRNKNYRLANLLRSTVLAFAFAMFVLLVIKFNWRHFIIDIDVFGISLGKIPVVKELLFVFPAILNYLLILFSLYKIDRIARREDFSFIQYIDFNLRLLLIPLPLMLLISIAEFVFSTIDGKSDFFGSLEFSAPAVSTVLMLLPVVIIAICFPFLIRLILRAKIMPESPMKQELHEIAQKAKVKYRNILLWQTGELKIPNAMVVGFFSKVRYVFITDAILNNFTHEEIKGVFAHELGHANKGHLKIYFLSLISFIFISFLILEPLSLRLGFFFNFSSSNILALREMFTAIGLISMFGFLIGYISRRFERQADLFAANLIGNNSFIDALYGIARIYGGGILSKPSITHGSLQSRINFLYAAEYNVKINDGFNRQMKILFSIFIAIIAATSVLLIKEIYTEIGTFSGKTAIYKADAIIESYQDKGYLSVEDEKDIETQLENAAKNHDLIPEIQYIRAMKLLQPLRIEDIEKAKVFLRKALNNKNISLFFRLVVLSTLEELNNAKISTE